MNRTHDWWRTRHEELLSMVEETCPLYVTNEETLNELFFDLLCLDTLDRLLYPLHANRCTEILTKACEMDLGFICVSRDEMNGLSESLPELDPRRILFEDKYARGTNLERAFLRDAHVVVKDVNALDEGHRRIGSGDVFVRLDGSRCPAGKGPEKFKVKGLCLSVNSGALSRRKDKTLTLIDEALKSFPEVQTLVIDDAGDFPVAHERDVPECLVPEEFFESLKDAFPPLSLWFSLPDALVSSAGVLLARVAAVGRKNGIPWIRIYVDGCHATRENIPEVRQRVVNLSKPDSSGEKWKRVILEDGSGEKCGGFMEARGAAEKDDLVLLAHTGAYRFRIARPFKEGGSIPERILPARKLCLVRL